MKKVICVAAAFMMVAGVATVASAEVNLSGDARARYTLVDKDVTGDDAADVWSSRVRLVVNATTEGGGFAKARINLADAQWDGTKQTGAFGEKSNMFLDYASCGMKFGTVTVEGGRQVTNFSKWFGFDGRADRLKVKVPWEGGFVAFTYDSKIEYTDNAIDESKDNDKSVVGASLKQKVGEDTTLMARLVYVADAVEFATVNDVVVAKGDMSGVKASVNVDTNFGANNIFAEVSYKDGDTTSAGKDQLGAVAHWAGDFGSVKPTVVVGMTQDGFLADDDFGFIMIGGDTPLTQCKQVGLGGDTMFAGVATSFTASDKLSFGANVLFVDVDAAGGSVNPLEISGYAKYVVGKGANVKALVGYLDTDGMMSGDPMGVAVTMNVAF